MSDDALGPERGWYPLCRSDRLRSRPRSVQLRGQALVLFRDRAGRPVALLDRCPHRNAPLSTGRSRDGELECGYHGWRFGSGGRCLAIPGLEGEPDAKGRRVPCFPTVERDGLVFAWGEAGGSPEGEPFPAPAGGDERFSNLWWEMELEASLQAALENILDVPHTAFLHGGLFRTSGRSNEIRADVVRTARGVRAEFHGEPRPEGWAGRLIAPGGGTVRHVDLFELPSVAQVRYAIGEDAELISTSWLLPEGEHRTRLFSLVRHRTRMPGWLVSPVLAPIAWWILRQDALMLRDISRNVERFGGERHSSTELDLLGAEIARLLKEGESPETDERPVRSVTFRA